MGDQLSAGGGPTAVALPLTVGFPLVEAPPQGESRWREAAGGVELPPVVELPWYAGGVGLPPAAGLPGQAGGVELSAAVGFPW